MRHVGGRVGRTRERRRESSARCKSCVITCRDGVRAPLVGEVSYTPREHRGGVSSIGRRWLVGNANGEFIAWDMLCCV